MRSGVFGLGPVLSLRGRVHRIIALAAVAGLLGLPQAVLSEAVAQQAASTCARCQNLVSAISASQNEQRNLRRDLDRTLGQVERIDSAIADLTSAKERNERSVAQVMRQRRTNRDPDDLPAIEARLRRLSEETADLDRKLATELDRKAQRFEKITWLNAVIERYRREILSLEQVNRTCARQCLPFETGREPIPFSIILDRGLATLQSGECNQCARFASDAATLGEQITSERKSLRNARSAFQQTSARLRTADAERARAVAAFRRALRTLGNFDNRERRQSIERDIDEATKRMRAQRSDVVNQRAQRRRRIEALAQSIAEKLDDLDELKARHASCVSTCRAEPTPEQVTPRTTDRKRASDVGSVDPDGPGRSVTPERPSVVSGRQPIAAPDPNGGDGKSQARLGGKPALSGRPAVGGKTAVPDISEAVDELPSAVVDAETAEDVDDTGPTVVATPVVVATPSVRAITPRPRARRRTAASRGRAPSLKDDFEFFEDEAPFMFPEEQNEVRWRVGHGQIELPTHSALVATAPAGVIVEGDTTLDAWSVEVSGTVDTSRITGGHALGEWEVRYTHATSEQGISGQSAQPGTLALAVPGAMPVIFTGAAATLDSGHIDNDYKELRGELRLALPSLLCSGTTITGGSCRSGVLAALQLSGTKETFSGTLGGGATRASYRNEMGSVAVAAGVWASYRQPLGTTPVGPLAFVLDGDAFVKAGVAEADGSLWLNGTRFATASQSDGYLGIGGELDAQLELQLSPSFLFAFGGRIGAETEPGLELDTSGLDLTFDTKVDAQLYLEGKFKF